MQQVIYDKSKTRRVLIFQRDDGAFSFEEEHFDDFESCWFPQSYRRSTAVCDTFETAMREAVGRVGWLADVVHDGGGR